MSEDELSLEVCVDADILEPELVGQVSASVQTATGTAGNYTPVTIFLRHSSVYYGNSVKCVRSTG